MQAVALPATFLFAPAMPAAASVGMHACLMMILAGLININPLYFIISAIVVHMGLVAWGFKEPHLEKVMQAKGYGYKSTKNLGKVEGFKQKYSP